MLVDGAGNLKMTKVSSGCSETRNVHMLKLFETRSNNIGWQSSAIRDADSSMPYSSC